MSEEDHSAEPSVRINLSTIYQEVISQGSKLDLVLSELHEVRTTTRETDTDHELRLRKIEEGAGQYVTHIQARGWLAVLFALVTILTGLVTLILHH